MILYKYLSFDSGMLALEGNSIGFSQRQYFNDPFDSTLYPPDNADNEVSQLFADVKSWAKNYIWTEQTGILALTRTPTNPLMWAHYANGHAGLVLGIDMDVAGFTNLCSNFIPAQYGSVIYTSSRLTDLPPPTDGPGMAVGATHNFMPNHYGKLQIIFLHKPICWSYEEEVRVAKCLKGVLENGGESDSGTFTKDSVDERPIYLYDLPEGSIKEVYAGMRVQSNKIDELAKFVENLPESPSIFRCRQDNYSLAINPQPV